VKSVELKSESSAVVESGGKSACLRPDIAATFIYEKFHRDTRIRQLVGRVEIMGRIA